MLHHWVSNIFQLVDSNILGTTINSNKNDQIDNSDDNSVKISISCNNNYNINNAPSANSKANTNERLPSP